MRLVTQKAIIFCLSFTILANAQAEDMDPVASTECSWHGKVFKVGG